MVVFFLSLWKKQTIEGKWWQLHCSEKSLQVFCGRWNHNFLHLHIFNLSRTLHRFYQSELLSNQVNLNNLNKGLNTTVTFSSTAWMMMKNYISLNLLWRWLADFCWRSFIQKLNFSERFGSFNKECYSLLLGFAPTKNRTMHIHRPAVLWSALFWHSYSGQSLFSYI